MTQKLQTVLSLVLFMAAFSLTACELMPLFEARPPESCAPDDTQWGDPCGPCLTGNELIRCGEDRRWHREDGCFRSPYDVDNDGFANQLCYDNEFPNNDCCGELDCDDSTAERFPGALADLDDDGRYDSRCCDLTDHENCTDCDDDDVNRYEDHADVDGDGHHDVRCGGDDCDDDDRLRWIGHADIDGDGHVDARCCEEDTPLCDDCDDDDPLRWGGHADLDDDGHISVGCGGDDCDDEHPSRWIGHADVDGDGHQDDRCCDEDSSLTCDDCNDNDPLRWTGNTDVDGDGHNDVRCRCDADELGAIHCDTFDDCDDDCEECAPGEAGWRRSALDHDCDGVVDGIQVPGREHETPEIVSIVDTGDSWSVAVMGTRVFVGTDERLYEVDVADPDSPEIVSFVSTGAVRDVAVWRDLVVAATDEGLVVIHRVPPGEGTQQLDLLSRLAEIGQSRGVFISWGYAIVAAYEAVFIVDLSMPELPAIVSRVGEPLVHDVRDVAPANDGVYGLTILALSRWTAAHPDSGGLTILNFSALVGRAPSNVDVLINQTRSERAIRVENPCESGYLVASEESVSLLIGYSEYFSYTLPGEARPQGIFSTCWFDDVFGRFTSYVAANDGLYWTFGANQFEEEDFVDTGHSRAVAVSSGHIYVATMEGLKILEY